MWPDFLTGDFLVVNTYSQCVITPLLSLRAPDLILRKYAKENGPTMSLLRKQESRTKTMDSASSAE